MESMMACWLLARKHNTMHHIEIQREELYNQLVEAIDNTTKAMDIVEIQMIYKCVPVISRNDV
jgi:hypothetical protein